MNLDNELQKLLADWLEDPGFIHWARQSNEQDIKQWEDYFNLHPQHWEVGKIGRSLVLGIPFREISREGAAGQQAMTALLDRLEGGAKIAPIPKSRGLRIRRSWWVAATVAVVLVLSGFGYFRFFYNPLVFLATGYGEQLETLLPDSSLVTLNADSRLKYYRLNPRKVWLKGEAYFTVKKKTETNEKFQVITEDLSVTVLGTSFNVNTRNDQTKVFLEEGKVVLDVVDHTTRVIEMQPGDLVAYSKKLNEIKEQRQDASALETAAWKEGALIFNDTPLLEALFEIEDIYGIQFVLQTDDLKKETISGGVPIKDLSTTLETLRDVYDLELKPVGKRYFVSPVD